MMLTCPRCMQGDIRHVRIKATSEELFTCDDCDAAWFRLDAIGREPWARLEACLCDRGLPELWSELELVADDGGDRWD